LDSRGIHKRGRRLPFATVAVTALGIAACDGGAPAVDASVPPSGRTSAVSLRIDVPNGKPASLTVLAFRAAFSGLAASDVLGVVDPLAVSAPLRDCALRDVDQAAGALTARGDTIELEELGGVGISLAELATAIRPSPRLYPDVTPTIGGVVSEAGPIRLSAVPAQLRVAAGELGAAAPAGPDTGELTTVDVPSTGWVRLLNGVVPRDGLSIETNADLNLAVSAAASPGASGAETSIELRPLGATVALSCLIPAETMTAALTAPQGQLPFIVSRQALGALVARSGAAPGAPVAAALDLVRRTNGRLPVSSTRVSVEVRTSTFVEIRP
jgi:hypothetical protein